MVKRVGPHREQGLVEIEGIGAHLGFEHFISRVQRKHWLYARSLE